MKEHLILQSKKEELILRTQEILRFDTVRSEEKENMPFGEGNAACLAYALNLCKDMGAETYNADNYAGHADFGQGEEIFGILGHLDVVPAEEDNWISPPFAAKIINDRIYARGAIDDKAPMIACLFAVKSLLEAGYKFKRRVRLIFGCDEESGMQCVKYYFKKVAPPHMAISPDADFPVINREKGIMHFNVNFGSLDKRILSIEGGTRSNVVMDKCTAAVTNCDISLCEGVEVLKEGDVYKLTARGVSSHGSTPQKGDNALWKMAKALYALTGDKKMEFIAKTMSDYTGKKWGVNLQDEQSGNLTVNMGVVSYKKDLLVTVDCRHPISFKNQQVIDNFVKHTPYPIEGLSAKEPLFVPEDSPLVQSLLKAYNIATGEKGYALSIGGGTYSRSMQNCVAFGPEFPNEPDIVIHQANEHISIDLLMRITKVYMEAIKQLCCE